MRWSMLVFAVACHSSTPKPPDLGTAGAPGVRAISTASFEANIKFLASDELAGRAPGTDGGAKAEQFLADQLQALGVEPAGEGGGYFQRVPLREVTRIDAETSLVIHGKSGDIAFAPEDVLLTPFIRKPVFDVEAPLVFVGYGISRPDLGYDDLAGVDLHGKVAVIFGGAPRAIGGKPIDSALRAVLSDLRRRSETLRSHGASAILQIYDPLRAQGMPFPIYKTKFVGPSMGWLEGTEVGSLPSLPVITIDASGFDRLVAGSARTLWEGLDRGEVQRVPLELTASMHVHGTARDITARNVVGILRGSDPKLASELVVYSAHSDHLGVGPPIAGDAIYNGALDNASGCAAMLEVARAFRALPRPPRRSILFVAVTAEEKGLLGSEYFVAHSPIPVERMVANINLDGVNMTYETFDLVPLGIEHSTLAAHARAAAAIAGLVLSPDPSPGQVYFIRSDQYSFVRAGIPATFPGAGELDANGTDHNKTISDAWGEHHYHRPSDDWHADYKAEWARKEITFDFLIGLSVANTDERPRWNPGDVFANLK